MSIKINALELENVKRIKAVALEPSPTGLTVIGGNNAQGKTSVLDSIAWALGGAKYTPSQPYREGSAVPPYLRVELSNGIVVERKGKNSSLTVTDPTGKKAGQQLLNEFIGQLALDLPKFMAASAKEKGDVLLQIIGVKDELEAIDKEIQIKYDQRTAAGRIADQKAKHVDEMPWWPDVPEELVSASELIKQQQEILARNGENQRKREQAQALDAKVQGLNDRIKDLVVRINELQNQYEQLLDERNQAVSDLQIARTSVETLQDESTAELEANLQNIEELNAKIRANQERMKADEEAAIMAGQVEDLTQEIESARAARLALLENARLPLPGLSVEDKELTYKGQRWDNMASSEQLMVAVSIVRELTPECAFVLIDKLEQLDLDTLQKFGDWLQSQDLQVIATRVSTGPECSVLIDDGYVMAAAAAAAATEEAAPAAPAAPTPAPAWKAGEF